LIVMRRFLHFFFAIAVVLGAAGAELRSPAEAPHACDCGCGAIIDPGQDSTCPCGMPQRSSQPCNGAPPQAIQAPARRVVAAQAASCEARREPRPCPEVLTLVDGSDIATKPIAQWDANAPRCLDRLAQLSVFRI